MDLIATVWVLTHPLHTWFPNIHAPKLQNEECYAYRQIFSYFPSTKNK